MTDYISGLSVNEATVVSFQVRVPEGVPVGTSYVGTIGFLSNSSDAAALDYRITVVPSIPAVLTIVTQNEATFFSPEKPNLDYVDIRVRSLTLGTVVRDNSGPNGTIVFNDLLEDFYEVTAQKAQHGTFRKTIFLQAPGQLLDAFLEFEAVSYVFSVIQVPVTDKYEIVVETTFTTRRFNLFSVCSCNVIFVLRLGIQSSVFVISFYRGTDACHPMEPAVFRLGCYQLKSH
jgi:hypothetical protein